MSLWVITILAVKPNEVAPGNASALAFLNVLTDRRAAEQEGQRLQNEHHPTDEGWQGHQTSLFEVPTTFEDHGHRVCITIDPGPLAHSVNRRKR